MEECQPRSQVRREISSAWTKSILLLPKSLAGRDEVDVTLTVDGQAANSVKATIKESFRAFH